MPKAELDINALPKHVGIIMDGNGRWAKKDYYQDLRGIKLA